MVKVYGTIGPSCRDEDTIKAMFREGMDGVRLNLSHTTLEEVAGQIENCHRAARACGVRPELLIDMQGPELRVGIFREPLRLTAGVRTDAEKLLLPEAVIEKLGDCAPGQDVLLDDGKLLLRTVRGLPGGVCLEVIRGGVLESRKSVALPGCSIHSPSMTERDRAQIRSAKEFGVTAVMQPFVRSSEDLIEVRSALKLAGCADVRLLAKIENRQGLEKLDELIPHCDEIVAARGDLGNAMELWELPAAQKLIAASCRRAGRDFMVVTQMLDSMMHRRVPTRAEVSDIFNAVLDGASSVMVTGETAAGDYPAEVIRYLVRTVREAEKYMGMQGEQRSMDRR